MNQLTNTPTDQAIDPMSTHTDEALLTSRTVSDQVEANTNVPIFGNHSDRNVNVLLWVRSRSEPGHKIYLSTGASTGANPNTAIQLVGGIGNHALARVEVGKTQTLYCTCTGDFGLEWTILAVSNAGG